MFDTNLLPQSSLNVARSSAALAQAMAEPSGTEPERLPLAVALPLIGGLSLALWMLIFKAVGAGF